MINKRARLLPYHQFLSSIYTEAGFKGHNKRNGDYSMESAHKHYFGALHRGK